MKNLVNLSNNMVIAESESEKFNKACEIYNACKQQMLDLKKSQESAKSILKALCPQIKAVYESAEYVFTTSETGMKETISVKDIAEKAPQILDQLKDLGLVKITDTAWKIGNIEEKVNILS